MRVAWVETVDKAEHMGPQKALDYALLLYNLDDSAGDVRLLALCLGFYPHWCMLSWTIGACRTSSGVVGCMWGAGLFAGNPGNLSMLSTII